LVINELLFNTASVRGDAEGKAKQIDDVVKRRRSQELGEKRHVEFYLPQFVSWKAGDLVIAVGGATSSGGDGPMSSYCYGFLIDIGTRQVRAALPEAGLKAKFGKECRVSP